MDNNWFRWEREASIHLIFPTLEAFYQTLYKYSGVKAPTMILVFKKGVVTWCIKEDEFIKYGQSLLNIYSDTQKEKKMVLDIQKSLKRLQKVENLQEKLDLNKLSDEKLIKIHSNLYRAFLNYYTMGAIGTPLSFTAEINLKQTRLSDEE